MPSNNEAGSNIVDPARWFNSLCPAYVGIDPSRHRRESAS